LHCVFCLDLDQPHPLLYRRLCYLFSSPLPPTDLHPLSLHDALPIFPSAPASPTAPRDSPRSWGRTSSPSSASSPAASIPAVTTRSEEHTSELQSHLNLVCRLLLEKKKKPSHRPSTPNTYSLTTSTTY